MAGTTAVVTASVIASCRAKMRSRAVALDAIPGRAHAVVQCIAHAEFPPDQRHVGCTALASEGGVARLSTIAGREMGQKIGAYVVKSVMQPAQTAMAR